jgi:hypothetical protein
MNKTDEELTPREGYFKGLADLNKYDYEEALRSIKGLQNRLKAHADLLVKLEALADFIITNSKSDSDPVIHLNIHKMATQALKDFKDGGTS